MKLPWRRRQPFVASEDLAGQLIEAHHQLDKVWDKLGGRDSEYRDLMLHIVELQSELMAVLEAELERQRKPLSSPGNPPNDA